MANFESFAKGPPFAFWLYRLSADVCCKILITLSHLALLCLTIFVMFVEQLIRDKLVIIIIIIIYSLSNEGDAINPMSYLTYGLRQPDGID